MSKLFADFETSGLDPLADVALEFAMVYTDRDLNILAERSFLIKWTPGEVETLYSDSHDRVVAMHEKNGLWEDLVAGSESSVPEEQFEDEVLAFIEDLEEAGYSVDTANLAGFNPFFDRQWLQVLAPLALKRIHYRSFDVSTLRTLAGDLGLTVPSRGPVPHRSLGDCHAAIEYARWFRSRVS